MLLAMLILGWSCGNRTTEKKSDLPEGTYKIEVEEVLQATSYTYLRADQDGKEIWIAIDKQEIPEGEILYYKDPLEMHNFESADLQKTFETIYFVQNVSKVPVIPEQQQQPAMSGMQTGKPVLTKIDVDVDMPENGVSIGEIYKNPGEYADKEVIVRGQVTKVNPAIMERNWIHIQDGTGDKEHFDLTVTTDDLPEVGDIVTYKGKISIDKDFGYGYAYDLLMEGAKKVE